ncbi:MAG: hypothetical protein LBR17_07970 [Bacteroidales bacterium]|jgi:hypothetical protein|nr:hypothetical protein [Bacteroidales bacterium]
MIEISQYKQELNDANSKNIMLDFNTSPLNRFPAPSTERCMLNEEGEVKIGDTIIKFLTNGYIEITDGYIQTLNMFNNGDTSVLSQHNVINKIDNNGFNCKANAVSSWYWPTYYYNFASNIEAILSFGMRMYYKTRVPSLWMQAKGETDLYITLINSSTGTRFHTRAMANQKIEITVNCIDWTCSYNVFTLHDTDSGYGQSIDVYSSALGLGIPNGYIENGTSAFCNAKCSLFPWEQIYITW